MFECFVARRGLAVFALILFVTAAFLRALFMSAARVSAAGVTRFKLFKRRSVHASVILGSIFYLQLCANACTFSTSD